MRRLSKQGRTAAAVLAALSGILFLSFVGCKGSTSPTSTTSNINVTNSCGATIMVYLDGALKATIENAANATIDNVAEGSRLVEAKKADTGVLISSKTIEIAKGTAYYVTIEGIVNVIVTNQYGEILGIYADSYYVGDIGDQITQNIPKVAFGSHVFEAKTKTDGTVVATTTIDVTDVIDYSWTITK
jgi:hypothetical protein